MSEEMIAVSSGTDDVIRLTDELRRIASRIRDSVPTRRPERLGIDTIGRPDHLALAEAMLSARRRIGNHFPPVLFADPARDLLLDLYASGLRGKPVSISSACIAAAVPATTALRCSFLQPSWNRAGARTSRLQPWRRDTISRPTK